MASPKRRIETDVMKLLMSDYKVNLVEDNMQEFYVCFEGPKDSPYEGGLWRIHVELPDQYPYKSPSIGFHNKIYHPNIDETSGSVCLDVINQTWSPMFTVFNIFDTFIPQLLNYPNAADPLNSNASTLYMRDKAKYNETVQFYVKKYANPEVVKTEFEDYEDDEEKSGKNEEDDENDDDDLSSVDGSDDEKKYVKNEKKDKDLDRNGDGNDDDDEEEVDDEDVDETEEEDDDDDLMDL